MAEDLFSKEHKNTEPGREDKSVHVPDIPIRPDKRPHPRESPASSCEALNKKGGNLREITDGQLKPNNLGHKYCGHHRGNG